MGKSGKWVSTKASLILIFYIKEAFVIKFYFYLVPNNLSPASPSPGTIYA